MSLAAGTYRGRLGGQIYQVEDPMGFQGLRGPGGSYGPYVDSGMTSGEYGPPRLAMFGRTKAIYSLRHGYTMQEKRDLMHQLDVARNAQFTTPSPVKTTLKAVGLGGLCGALLAAVL